MPTINVGLNGALKSLFLKADRVRANLQIRGKRILRQRRVLTVVDVDVSTWVTVTVTSGTLEPEESVTTPTMPPVVT